MKDIRQIVSSLGPICGRWLMIFVILFLATVSQAQRVEHDFDNDGYRHINTGVTPVLTPPGTVFSISISLNYFQGFSTPYYIRLYSRYEISRADELILTLSDGQEMHLHAYHDNTMYSRLGLPFKAVTIYDVLYQLNEQQLNDLLNSSVAAVKIGSGDEWHIKNFKNDKIGKWLKSNYKAIGKRLAKDIEKFVSNQMQTYPKSRLLDIYKSCFQDYMGAEHLVSDRQRVKAYLDEELNTTNVDELMPWYYEPCGTDNSYYRVSIRAIKEGIITEDQLLDAFIRSANGRSSESRQRLQEGEHSSGMARLDGRVVKDEGDANSETRPSVKSWSNRWHMIIGTIDKMKLNLPNYQEDKQFIDSILSVGKYAISHSPDYREAYHPHYRIVERNIFEKEFKPLIDRGKK